MANDDADLDAAMLDALAATEAESKMLAFVTDEALRDELLFCLLRAPVGEPVRVQVNARMNESDNGGKLRELLAHGEFVDATLTPATRADGNGVSSFALHCKGMPNLNRTYDGDDLEDKLIQFFAKELIRFPRSPPSYVRGLGLHATCMCSFYDGVCCACPCNA